MHVEIADDFDLKKIADSGQCFRWTETEGGYRIVAGGHNLVIRSIGNTEPVPGKCIDRHSENGEGGDAKHYLLNCTREEYEDFWRHYFDLDLQYAAVREKIDPKQDPYLYRASVCGRGIRILNQDPWEMLITFIISQRKNIPAIRLSVEKLCTLAGDQIGEGIFSFPAPEQLAALSEDELLGCSLGYRAKYIRNVARAAADGAIDFDELATLPDQELRQELMKLYGVGIKVANCEMLFGFHRLDSFPEDVWVLRLLQEQYPEGFPFALYRPYNGIMQQYLFWYRRTVQV
ncbi:MAG: DNA glycosylase [Bilifractor sp.]